MRIVHPDQAQRIGRGRPQQPLPEHPARSGVRHQHGRPGRRPAAHAVAQAGAGSLRAPPPRGGDPPHRVRAAQGARPRPCAGRPDRRAGQHRRDDRADQDLEEPRGSARAHAGAFMGAGPGARAAGRGWRGRVAARDPGRRVRAARGGLPPVRVAGQGNPRDAPVQADRPRAGEADRRIPRDPGRDPRADRDPREPRSPAGGDPRRTGRDQGELRRQAPHGDPAQPGRPLDGGPDHAGGPGGHALPRRLRQEPAGGGLPRAEARWARPQRHRDQGRGLHRAPAGRAQPRHHPVLHQRRPRVLVAHLPVPQRGTELARAADRQPAALAGRRREGQRHAAGQGLPRGSFRVLRDPRRAW